MLRRRLIIANTISYAVVVPLSFLLFFLCLVMAYETGVHPLLLCIPVGVGILILPSAIIQSLLLRGGMEKRKIAFSVGITAILGGLMGGLVSGFMGWIMWVIFFSLALNFGLRPTLATWALFLSASAIAGAIIGFLSRLPTILIHKDATAESEM